MEYRIDLAIVRLQIGKGRLVDESICRSSPSSRPDSRDGSAEVAP